jgi:predicted nucleotidyltransferase
MAEPLDGMQFDERGLPIFPRDTLNSSPWLPERTILVVRAGSHAYGTSLPTSDRDYRGIAVAPKAYRDGFTKRFEQAEIKNPDVVIFNLPKFMSLAADSNPNILELVFVDESDVLLATEGGRLLREHRNAFLSKRAVHRFRGYAMAQLKRIKTHKKWLLSPPDHQPTREEFGLPQRTLIPADQLAAAQAEVKKMVDGWEIDFGGLADSEVVYVQEQIHRHLADIHVGRDEKANIAARLLGYDTNFIELLDRERRYQAAQNNWVQYQDWKENRNEKRSALEAQFGYDCYLDDTEFLTDHGWKRYDEVAAEDRLATLNQGSGRVEYQHYTDRVAKPYTGKIGVLSPRHSNCAVTLNHRMWVSPLHRSPKNHFSCAYNHEDADWGIHPLHELVSGSRSYYHIRLAGEKHEETVDVPYLYLTLMGAYLSEGCVGKRLKDGSASVLRISQKKGGRITKWMDDLAYQLPEQVNRYEIVRDEDWRSEPCVEVVWTVAHREWASRLEEECGSGSANKHLPFWVRELPTRGVQKLLEVMRDGDGNESDHGDGWIYNTSSKRLADDIQAMCVSAGIVSAVWGPYPDKRTGTLMYQVFVRDLNEKVLGPYATVRICGEGSQNFEVQEVRDARIVCFTVPNEILVTRRNGQVAIQGNTKHAMHLVRLMRMCREILTTGEVLVKRPDAEELLSIRNGAWTYEKLIEWADFEDNDLQEVAKSSSLPRSPNMNFLDDLCQEITRMMD